MLAPENESLEQNGSVVCAHLDRRGVRMPPPQLRTYAFHQYVIQNPFVFLKRVRSFRPETFKPVECVPADDSGCTHSHFREVNGFVPQPCAPPSTHAGVEKIH